MSSENIMYYVVRLLQLIALVTKLHLILCIVKVKLQLDILFETNTSTPRPFYAGINFYTRKQVLSAEELQEIEDVARQQGLGYWLDTGIDFNKVNHTGCTYPPLDEDLKRRLNIKDEN